MGQYQIIRIPEIAPVPNSPEFIRGILNLRGTIVVVVDLEEAQKTATPQSGAKSRLLILLDLPKMLQEGELLNVKTIVTESALK